MKKLPKPLKQISAGKLESLLHYYCLSQRSQWGSIHSELRTYSRDFATRSFGNAAGNSRTQDMTSSLKGLFEDLGSGNNDGMICRRCPFVWQEIGIVCEKKAR